MLLTLILQQKHNILGTPGPGNSSIDTTKKDLKFVPDMKEAEIIDQKDLDKISVDNLLERPPVGPLMQSKKVTADWVVGLVDGDGSFGFHLQKRNNLSVLFEFKITSHYYSVDVLLAIQDFFGCGSVVIDNREDKTLKFHVTNRKDIKQFIIPVFDSHPLLTSKRLDYEGFKRAVELVDNDVHRQSNGFEQFKVILDTMNNKRNYSQRVQFSKEITAISTLTPEWIAGFVDAEANFNFGMTYQKPRGAQGVRTLLLQPVFAITQHIQNYYILLKFKDYFKKGYIKVQGKRVPENFDPLKENPGVGRFEIKNSDHLNLTIYPFFEQYANLLLTMKAVEYADWKLLVEHKRNKTHLTQEGLELMWNIKRFTHGGRTKPPIFGDLRSEAIVKNLLRQGHEGPAAPSPGPS